MSCTSRDIVIQSVGKILAPVKSLARVRVLGKLRTPVEEAPGMVTVPVNVRLALGAKLLS